MKKTFINMYKQVVGVLDRLYMLFTYYRKTLFLAFMWLMFMLFFTYTTLFVEICKINGNFSEMFYSEHSGYIALYVNMGLVVMLLFDNHAVNKKFNGMVYYLPFLGLLIPFLIMGHCNLVKTGEHINYIIPISKEWFSYVMYIAFLILLYIMKVRSLLPETVNVKKQTN